MFAVFENNKPALLKGWRIKWENNKFQTLAEAQQYAWEWLGTYAPELPSDIKFNVPYDYSGSGDVVEIRSVL